MPTDEAIKAPERPREGTLLAAMLGRARPYAPALLASLVLCAVCVQGIVARAGQPAAPLDDAFIHLQYARRLAEGHFFSYVAGEGYTTGSTSLLWPLALAPFYKLGLRGLSLLWVSWALSTLAHAGLCVEAARLADRLAGRAAAVGAGVMCASFGAFAWFAWSGMETVPFAWILLRTARIAAVRCDKEEADDKGADAELVALGIAAPLLRPEGFLASILAAVALAARPRRPALRSRLLALAPLAGPLVVPALHLAFAGHATASTVTVKWLVASPYESGPDLAATILDNARFLLTNLLYGEDWTALFLPEGSNVPILLGLPALFLAGSRRRAPYHAAFVAVIALGALIPCTYLSFLWNRVRYLWPFAGAWFVMLACLAREASDLVRRARPSLTFVTPLLCGVFTGALLSRLPWAVRDLAEASSAINDQQVALARWASESLPASARIGVNDAGAIAYLSDRPTFDVVGLTTEGEARYWAAGAGSRFEHYERTPRDRLPTHFIVYPHWMACPPVLGEELKEATVLDQSILGGPTMIAYEARYDALGSGDAPVRAPPSAALIDEVDVADLESEAAHGYALERAWEQDNQAAFLPPPETDVPLLGPADERATERAADPERALLADGGRANRARDRFHVRLPAGRRAALLLRASADDDLTLSVSVAGRRAGEARVPAGAWVERLINLDLDLAGASGDVPIEVAAEGGGRFGSFHYWVYAL